MSMSITPASELDLSLITFAGSDFTLTGQGGDKAKKRRQEVCVCVWEGGGIIEAINRGTAIIRGNTVLRNFKFPFFVPSVLGCWFTHFRPRDVLRIFFWCLISNMHSFERE